VVGFVVYAETVLPASWTFMLIGFAEFGLVTMRRRSKNAYLTAAAA
jgi:hypothetical protein